MKCVLLSDIVFLLLLASFTSAMQLVYGPISQKVNVGDTVTLECSVSSIQKGESVVWKHVELVPKDNGTYISIRNLLYFTDPELRRRYEVIGTNKERDFHLQIKEVQPADEGRFECGYLDSRQSFIKLAEATLTINEPVEGAPTCEVFPKNPNIGDAITLTCSVAPGLMSDQTLIWDMNNQEVMRQKGTPTLRYHRVLQRSDEGAVFQCKSISSAYPSGPSCLITALSRPPVATVRSDAPFYRVGDNATFICSEMNGESVQYSWTKVDVNILMSRRFELKAENRVLIVNNLERNDNNSIFECQVTNANKQSSVASITIEIVNGTISRPGGQPTVLAPLVEKNSLHPAVIVVFVLLVVAIVVILALVIIKCSRRKSRQSRSHSKM